MNDWIRDAIDAKYARYEAPNTAPEAPAPDVDFGGGTPPPGVPTLIDDVGAAVRRRLFGG